MRVIRIEGAEGVVELGGVRRRISLLLLDDVKVGDYVIVHAGFAISRLDPDDARETLELLGSALDAG
jgi:hydrogenase expression/formation protein HypC